MVRATRAEVEVILITEVEKTRIALKQIGLDKKFNEESQRMVKHNTLEYLSEGSYCDKFYVTYKEMIKYKKLVDKDLI